MTTRGLKFYSDIQIGLAIYKVLIICLGIFHACSAVKELQIIPNSLARSAVKELQFINNSHMTYMMSFGSYIQFFCSFSFAHVFHLRLLTTQLVSSNYFFYLNNAVIRFLIYYPSHMTIARHIEAIISECF